MEVLVEQVEGPERADRPTPFLKDKRFGGAGVPPTGSTDTVRGTVLIFGFNGSGQSLATGPSGPMTAHPEMIRLDREVTALLDAAGHPMRTAIEALRQLILGLDPGIVEQVKWNGPHYTLGGADRLTLRVHPPRPRFELVLHRGARPAAGDVLPEVADPRGLLVWRAADRAVLPFSETHPPSSLEAEVIPMLRAWLDLPPEGGPG